MWPPRHDKQLEITTNIGVKGCAVGCIVCPQEKLYTTYNLYPNKVKNLSFAEKIRQRKKEDPNFRSLTDLPTTVAAR